MTNAEQSLTNILIIGAGELGLSVIKGLSELHPKSTTSISVFLRPPITENSKNVINRLKDEGHSVIFGDLSAQSIDDLANVFARFETVICCSGFVSGPGTQLKITTAVLNAGVKRYVPWQFGVDYDIIGKNSGQQVFDEQIDVRNMLRKQNSTEWIIISTGMFTSFLFEPAFGVVDLNHPSVCALGDWNNHLTVTAVEDIGRLTAIILAHEPRVKNEVVFIAGDTFSYSELAAIVERHLGCQVAKTLLSLNMLRDDVESHPDKGMPKYRLAFARENGVAWDKKQTFNELNKIDALDVSKWLEGHRPVK